MSVKNCFSGIKTLNSHLNFRQYYIIIFMSKSTRLLLAGAYIELAFYAIFQKLLFANTHLFQHTSDTRNKWQQGWYAPSVLYDE